MNSPTHPPAIYDLIGVSNHSGNMGFGHYTATCYHHDMRQWYDFNDSSVTELGNAENIIVC